MNDQYAQHVRDEYSKAILLGHVTHEGAAWQGVYTFVIKSVDVAIHREWILQRLGRLVNEAVRSRPYNAEEFGRRLGRAFREAPFFNERISFVIGPEENDKHLMPFMHIHHLIAVCGSVLFLSDPLAQQLADGGPGASV